jgi:adenylate cyclase, class 2
MAIETEKKYRLTEEHREQILSGLLEFGAEYIREDFEENNLYGGGILQEKGAVLRVRKIGAKTILTFKQSVQNQLAVKQRIEHETIVENTEELEKIIENLGFYKILVYEKRRRIWRFRRAEVVIDELPFGLFMEIEGAVNAIAEAEMLLGAEDFEVEHRTYPRLTAKLGKRNGEVIEARFLPYLETCTK